MKAPTMVYPHQNDQNFPYNLQDINRKIRIIFSIQLDIFNLFLQTINKQNAINTI